ncbi:MAG: hypothetical protein IJ558_07140 [Treponema sp.]|nr:hypothetical protein [Treponema sp.]
MENKDCTLCDYIFCGVLKIVLAILVLAGTALILFFIFQMVKEAVFDHLNDLAKKVSDVEYFNTLLSGIIGAIISAVLVYAGLKRGNTTKKIDNQLKLREMFSEKRRWEVHRTLMTGNISYWCKKAEENGKNENSDETPTSDKDWTNSKVYKDYFEPALDDYMGLFEIAHMMLRKNQLSRKDFTSSYLYRLRVLSKKEYVMDKINKTEYLGWKELRDLFNEFSI